MGKGRFVPRGGNYEAFANGFMASLDPDHVTDVVIMFGANDDEGLRDDNHKGEWRTMSR